MMELSSYGNLTMRCMSDRNFAMSRFGQGKSHQTLHQLLEPVVQLKSMTDYMGSSGILVNLFLQVMAMTDQFWPNR